MSFNKRYININFNPSVAEDDDVRTDLFKCSLFASEEKDAWLQWTSWKWKYSFHLVAWNAESSLFRKSEKKNYTIADETALWGNNMISFAKNSIRTHINENNPIYCFTYIYKIPKKINKIQWDKHDLLMEACNKNMY